MFTSHFIIKFLFMYVWLLAHRKKVFSYLLRVFDFSYMNIHTMVRGWWMANSEIGRKTAPCKTEWDILLWELRAAHSTYLIEFTGFSFIKTRRSARAGRNGEIAGMNIALVIQFSQLCVVCSLFGYIPQQLWKKLKWRCWASWTRIAQRQKKRVHNTSINKRRENTELFIYSHWRVSQRSELTWAWKWSYNKNWKTFFFPLQIFSFYFTFSRRRTQALFTNTRSSTLPPWQCWRFLISEGKWMKICH